MKKQAAITLAVALPCEAKPLVAHYGLRKDLSARAFEIYRNATMCLTVTGPGKNAMSAGLAYTQAITANSANPLVINVGVAGHRTHAIGSAWTALKICDRETNRNFYPMPVYGLPCKPASIMTASKPQLDYNHERLCDMEASAFFETAARFSTCELINCLKIVSDNPTEPGHKLDPKHLEKLIRDNIGMLEGIIEKLEERAQDVIPIDIPVYERLTKQYRMTVSEQIRLKGLLSRLCVLTGDTIETVDTDTIKTGKQLLTMLANRFDAIKYEL